MTHRTDTLPKHYQDAYRAKGKQGLIAMLIRDLGKIKIKTEGYLDKEYKEALYLVWDARMRDVAEYLGIVPHTLDFMVRALVDIIGAGEASTLYFSD